MNVIINGVEGEFILDTGAGVIVIKTKRKDKFNLKTEKTENTGTGTEGTATLEESAKNKIKKE